MINQKTHGVVNSVVDLTVRDEVSGVVDWFTWGTVTWVVAEAVDDAVDDAVWRAVYGALHEDPPHSGFQSFLRPYGAQDTETP